MDSTKTKDAERERERTKVEVEVGNEADSRIGSQMTAEEACACCFASLGVLDQAAHACSNGVTLGSGSYIACHCAVTQITDPPHTSLSCDAPFMSRRAFCTVLREMS